MQLAYVTKRPIWIPNSTILIDYAAQSFEYELNTRPMPLFKNGFIRKAKTPEICLCLVIGNNVESTSNDKYILDGGAPLHKVMWGEGETHQRIIDRYTAYVKNRFGDCCVLLMDVI